MLEASPGHVSDLMTPLLYSILPYKAAILLLALYTLPAQAQDVRIRLLDRQAPTSITLSAYEGVVRLHAGEYTDALLEMETGQTVLISPYGPSNELRVSSEALTLYAETLRAEPVDGASFGIETRDDKAAQASRRYTGNLLISTDQNDEGLKLINAVPLEAYVASVVSTEYGLDDLEGSKAMAVLARTYVLNAPGKYGPDYDLVDDTRSQVYRGEDVILPLALEAARLTGGEVLTWRGKPIQAVYHSSSGGHTADNESVWSSSPVPYLRGKPDPYGKQSPHAEWVSRVPRPKLLAELGKKFDGEVIGFLLDERSPDGRVASVSLLMQNGQRRSVAGNEFRLVVIWHFGPRSLRSMRFDAERQGNEYVFTGQGYGHGVGLSQWGAHDMAKRGMSYKEILDFYYTGATLSRLEETDAPPATRYSSGAIVGKAPVDTAVEESPLPPVETVSEKENPETPVETAETPENARSPAQTRRVGW